MIRGDLFSLETNCRNLECEIRIVVFPPTSPISQLDRPYPQYTSTSPRVSAARGARPSERSYRVDESVGYTRSPEYSRNPQNPAERNPFSTSKAAARAARPPPCQAVRIILSLGNSSKRSSNSNNGI